MNLLYLDFDGVLHDEVYVYRKHGIYIKCGEQVLNDVGRRQPVSWFAIDNDNEGWPETHQRHLIKTAPSLGISQLSVQHQIPAYLKHLSKL